MTSEYYDYAAEYAALDADVLAACLSLAPHYGGAGVDLGDLDDLCRALGRPVRDDRERHELMTRLDPENAMRIDRAAVTAWLLEELLVAAQQQHQQAVVDPEHRVRRPVAVPTWEEIVEPPVETGAPASVYYYNTLTGETAWSLVAPLAVCLYRHIQDIAEVRTLKAPVDADGFVVVDGGVEMVDDLKTVFAKCDDDRDGLLDENEFRDLCVALAFPLGDGVRQTMQQIDPRVDGSRFSGVSWNALLEFWTSHTPYQRRTRLAPPYELWEKVERLDRRAQPASFRHVTTLHERWHPPSTDQHVVDLLTRLFPSSKLEWKQRVAMFWELQLQRKDGGVDARSVWTLRDCRVVFEQLGWDHCTRREHVIAAVRNLQNRYGGGRSESTDVVLENETVVAWMQDCIARVEMDGWEECLDESSGQRYYYHEIRGLTQWDPPQMEDRMAKMMARFSGGSKDDQIKRIFRHYDDDESGSISFCEFKRLYIALLGRKEAITGESEDEDAQIQQVFSVLDTSGDDEVSLEEFMVWWKTKMNIEDEETEQQRLARVAAERRRIAIQFLQYHDALISKPVPSQAVSSGDAGQDAVYSFESNILARLVAVLGKYPLKGLAYRDALSELVHANRLVDQEIVLEEFLDWYVTFEESEHEREELEAQKARALALLQAQEAETKEKARKLKMIKKGQLITKAIASDATVGGTPEPAELIWKRHIQTLFRKFDRDSSGYLDAAELKELTQALGHALDDAQIQQMMAIMDSSGDERVSVDEFVTFWTAFQRRKRAAESGTTGKKAVQVETKASDEPHRREAISMVNASANLSVSMELAKERALKMSITDVKDALGDWKESLLDRSRKKREAIELAEQDRKRLEELRKQWASFVPTKNRRYAHLDVTWIEPEVVGCMVDMIETVRRRTRPLPRQDAAQRIQRIMRGAVTRMRLFAMVLDRFRVHVDMETGFFYYVDTEDHGRVWLHRPLFPTITSSVTPWDFSDCKTKVERLRFRHREREMHAKQRFHHRFIWTSEADTLLWKQPEHALFVPASFVVYNVIAKVRVRLLGNIWHALRDRSFVLAELMARRHRRQLTVRSNNDASAPLPLHYVVKHHATTPFRVIQAIFEGHPDAVRERDAYGRTPLHLAFRERAGRRIVELLLSRRRRLIDEATRTTKKRTSVWEMQSLSGETPLHVALRYRVSLELLRWICRHESLADVTDDAIVKICNKPGHAIFHLVVSSLFDATNAAYWRSIVVVLLRTWPRRVLCSGANGAGDLPLHLAIERYAAVLTTRAMQHNIKALSEHDGDETSWLWLIRLLITEYPNALLVRRKHDSLLAIHLLMRVPLVPESLVIEALNTTVTVWRSSISSKLSTHAAADELSALVMLHETKATLLHYALLHRSFSESLVLKLVDMLPNACHVKMQPQAELPLHLAARHGASVAVMTRLCETYGAACQERNTKQELPLHIAVSSPAATEAVVRVLLHYCPFVLSEPRERHGLRSLVMASNAANPNIGILRALLDHTPPQKLTAHATKRHVTPLYAISFRKCDASLANSGVLDEMETKYEAMEDDDAYFLAMARAKLRKQHHCPTARWPFEKILELMARNPVDEAIIQRSLLAMIDKLNQMQATDSLGNQESDGLGVVVDMVTLNKEWSVVQRVHQTLYELPWNARVQLLGQQVLTKLLPNAFAKAAYKARVDPYFNL